MSDSSNTFSGQFGLGMLCCLMAILFLFGMFNLGWETGARQCVNHPQNSYCQGLKGK